MSFNDIKKGGSAYFVDVGVGGTTILPNTTIDSAGNLTTILFEARGATISNALQTSQMEVYGANRPAGSAAFYCSGGTTLTGDGATHGVHLGALTVLGVDTQRIDVFPVGIDINAATYVQVAAGGAGSFAAGGAMSIAAGDYVEYNSDEHRFINTTSGNDQTYMSIGNINGPYNLPNSPLTISNTTSGGIVINGVKTFTGLSSSPAVMSNISSMTMSSGALLSGVKTFTGSNTIMTNISSVAMISGAITGLSTINGNQTNVRGYFYDTTTQTVSAANTPTIVTFNTTSISSGVSLSGTSQIKVDYPGLYEFIFSAQLDKSGANAENCDIWIRKNGTDVSDSASQYVVQGSSGETATCIEYLLNLSANDNVQVVFASPDNTMAMTAFPAITTPYNRPGIPSIIASLKMLPV